MEWSQSSFILKYVAAVAPKAHGLKQSDARLRYGIRVRNWKTQSLREALQEIMKPTIRSSSLDRVLSCNGSLTLERMVEPRSGDEGDEGTLIHSKIGWRLVHELGAAHDEFPDGFSYTPSGHITDWIVNFCFNAVRDNTPLDWSLRIEMSLAYEWDRFILSGHPDVVAMSPDVTEFLIDDFKTGHAAVDVAEMNWQLLAYAVLLKRAYPTLKKGKLRIIQPRNNEDEGDPRISGAEINDLDAAAATLEARVNAALDNCMEVDSGMSQCKWCPAARPGQCPAVQALFEIMKVTLTPEILAKIKRLPDDAQLGDWIIAARTLKRPIEDAEKLLHERLDSNPSIVAGCGTQISRTIQNGSYSWPDPLRAFAAIKELLPTDESQAKVFTPSVTKIKDEIAAVMQIPKTGQAAVTSEGVFDAKIKPLAEQGKRKILVFK